MYIISITQLYFLLSFCMKKSVFFRTSFKPKIPSYLAELPSNKLGNTNYIHMINNNTWYHQNAVDIFITDNDFVKNKKIISISPGGYKGFYVLGICKYIKQHYNLDNYIFSGASAGAWNSLILSSSHEFTHIEKHLVDKKIQTATSLYEMEHILKNKLLTKYNSDDFDLRRLFVGVTTMQNYHSNTIVYSGFSDLEDAINCCIASSHIPFVTGGLTNVYRDIVSFDGGFSKYPYLNIMKPVLHITPSIWKKKDKNDENTKMSITDYTTLFSKNKFVFVEMINSGYKDASENKEMLDKIFLGN